jgi:hypothetical protein
MFLKIWLANIVLALAVFFTGMKSIEAWTQRPIFKISAAQATSGWPEKGLEKRAVPPETDYEMVVKGNLFFADRSEVVEKPPESAPVDTQPIVMGPQLQMLEQVVKRINLYGVFVVDDRKEAFIDEIAVGRRGAPGESGIKRAKAGDTVGRFKVKEIHNRSVILAAGGHEWEIFLFDKDNPKKRVAVARETGPVVAGDASKPEAGQAHEAGKEKERLPESAISSKAIPDKGQRPQGTLRVTDKLRPGATPDALQPKPMPTIPGPGKR